MQRGLIVMKWQTTITKKTSNEKLVICHKLTNNWSAQATMMCERDEEPRPNATTHYRIVMACVYSKNMDAWCQ
jgi:hypothetical protein